MTVQISSVAQNLADQVKSLRKWLHEEAFPLWWEVGSAKPDNGFYERISQDAKPVFADNRRARVQPRQAYCFAAAGQNGWDGPWKEAVVHGISWFDRVYRLDNGLYGNLADQTGKLIDPSFNLYNQAFELFATAQAAASLPDRKHEMHDRALDILTILRREYKHPIAGFEEARPPREPLCSNPHMHLFEAMLAWEVEDRDGPWAALADEIADLTMSRFIDEENGGLREFFDHDWKPASGDKGRIMEPGHQFEWAGLLARWGSLRTNNEAIAKARRLFAISEAHGICPRRKVAIMSHYDDFSVHDELARLWPQTEWLKAAVRLASVTTVEENRQTYLASGIRAIAALRPFLDTPVKGLWFDKWPADAPMLDEPAPASTFYHIVGAICESEALLAIKS